MRSTSTMCLNNKTARVLSCVLVPYGKSSPRAEASQRSSHMWRERTVER
jgi:hypothetical protein